MCFNASDDSIIYSETTTHFKTESKSEIWNTSIDGILNKSCRGDSFLRYYHVSPFNGQSDWLPDWILNKSCWLDSSGENEAVGPTAFGQRVLCVGILV